jgi:ElaB/YqjD/DUF883 family membrane-anchored ribosome-binding protein
MQAKDLADTGKGLSAAGSQAAEFISNMTSVAQDKMAAAKRAARKGWSATEDLIDDTAHTIKKNPLRSAGISLGIGIGVGMLIGWFAWRK